MVKLAGVGNTVNVRLVEGERADGVLFGVVWMGIHQHKNSKYAQNDPKSRLKLIFEFPQTIEEGLDSATIAANINVSVNEAGSLYPIASVLLGRKLLDLVGRVKGRQYSRDLEQYLGGNKPFNECLGKQFTVALESYVAGDGQERLKVESIRAPHPKDDPVTATRDFIYFDPYNADLEQWAKLTMWTKKDIMSAIDNEDYSVELHKQWAKDQEAEDLKNNNNNDSVNENLV